MRRRFGMSLTLYTQKLKSLWGGVLDCTRTWEAWSYGTMTEEDFKEVSESEERVMEIFGENYPLTIGRVMEALSKISETWDYYKIDCWGNLFRVYYGEEDKNCTKELEEFICKLTILNPDKTEADHTSQSSECLEKLLNILEK